MPTFVMLLELNGVDMFFDATVSGVTETFNYKTKQYCRIQFSPKFCNCEVRDPSVSSILFNLNKEIYYKKLPFEYLKMNEITIQTDLLGEVTLYNRNQELETDIDIHHCKACWGKHNWD